MLNREIQEKRRKKEDGKERKDRGNEERKETKID
jgi:hypothetical protein